MAPVGVRRVRAMKRSRAADPWSDDDADDEKLLAEQVEDAPGAAAGTVDADEDAAAAAADDDDDEPFVNASFSGAGAGATASAADVLASVCFDGGALGAANGDGEDDVGEFSGDEDADVDPGAPPPPLPPPSERPVPVASAAAAAAAAAASVSEAQSNPLVDLADALHTPVSMLDAMKAPHSIVEAAFRNRQARTARVRHDGTLDAPVARLPLALDEEARRDRAQAAASGDMRTRLMMARMFDVGGTCPRPPPNGLVTEIERLVKFLRHVPANRSVAIPDIRAKIERCIVDRETPTRWDDLHRLLRWRSARDDTHFMVQAGCRPSPVNPTLMIDSRPCVNGERCEGFRNFTQLADCPEGSFMPIGYISKEELAEHYRTGRWPEGGAGNVPCIFCTWFVPQYLQSSQWFERGSQWLPFVVAQCDFNSVGTFHGYRPECVLRRSGQQDSIVLAPLAKWDSNLLGPVYKCPQSGRLRIDHDRMLVAPLGRGSSLATFSSDRENEHPSLTECVPTEALNVPNARATQALHAAAAAAARPAPLPGPTPARRPQPFFGPGARSQPRA